MTQFGIDDSWRQARRTARRQAKLRRWAFRFACFAVPMAAGAALYAAAAHAIGG